MAAPSDRSLLLAFHRGNESAARSLYAQTAPGLIAYAQSILRNQALAEDAVQNVFCKVLTMPGHEVRRVEGVRAWLARLVRNEAISIQRSAVRRRDREVSREQQSAGGMLTHNASASTDDLRRAVDRLDDDRREIVVLKCGMGLTFDQVAETLNMNRNTAASRYREAIAQLREILGADAPSRSSAKVVSHA